ncbi:myeloid leukemia factor 1 isoform X1 [Sardina pilchardus]|uniref:myeloid leukemia factor 1 isoform X1 n=1 Tax=Sardina pilchardus TaxID=27697 RepID=UPI002E104996
MFNSLLREFEEDSFFADPFQAHNERVRQMMRSFSDPFGHGLMPSLTDGRSRVPTQTQPQPNGALQENQNPRGRSNSLVPFGFGDHMGMDLRNPFSMMDNMMMGMRGRMDDMHRNFENLSTDSNTHSFSSSSISTYSKVGNEPPKVFQAHSQTRRAPGGVSETRRSLKDSDSGVEKMSIGHHIQDRGHVIEKKRNHKTGEREFNQDFQNMDESEAEEFDEEWQKEVSKFEPVAPLARIEASKPRARTVHRAAIAAPDNARLSPKVEGKKTHIHEIKVQRPGVQEP